MLLTGDVFNVLNGHEDLAGYCIIKVQSVQSVHAHEVFKFKRLVS